MSLSFSCFSCSSLWLRFDCTFAFRFIAWCSNCNLLCPLTLFSLLCCEAPIDFSGRSNFLAVFWKFSLHLCCWVSISFNNYWFWYTFQESCFEIWVIFFELHLFMAFWTQVRNGLVFQSYMFKQQILTFNLEKDFC